MKRTSGILAIIATTALLSAANIIGAEISIDNSSQKDECLLLAMNCAGEVDSINQRIERLNNEIAKGTAVYTVDELKLLRNKLDEAVGLLGGLIKS
jgi:anti-sigma28 factor (negative regulator of flagellin synthesis)